MAWRNSVGISLTLRNRNLSSTNLVNSLQPGQAYRSRSQQLGSTKRPYSSLGETQCLQATL